MTDIGRRKEFIFRMGLLFKIADAKGIFFIPYCFHRTTRTQQDLYAIGRTRPGRRVTNCDGVIKKSKHQFWEAEDCIVIKGKKWMWEGCPEYGILGRLAPDLGLVWGGDWDADGEVDPTDWDKFHFQLGE